MQDGFLRKKKKIKKEYLDILDTEIGLAVIIHFTGSKKPWHYKSVHPYKSVYFKYLDLTREYTENQMFVNEQLSRALKSDMADVRESLAVFTGRAYVKDGMVKYK